MSHWSERREGGNQFWLRLIRWIILHVGRGFACAAMTPTAVYFFLRRGPERRASRAWLSQALGRPAGYRQVLRHIRTFAITIVDRVLLLSGRMETLNIRAEGHDHLHEYLDRGTGCVLLGSHLGSFEAIRVFSRDAPQYRLKVVMDRNQNATMTRLMDSMCPEIAGTVIDARQPGTQVVLDVNQALAEGQMAAMLADRAHRREPVVQVPFMGRMAPFPSSPMLIASVTRVPVFLVFGLYEGGNRYRLVFEHFADEIRVDRRHRRAQIEAWVARYAERLEYYARTYPYNWFNFYDFWNPETAEDARSDPD